MKVGLLYLLFLFVPLFLSAQRDSVSNPGRSKKVTHSFGIQYNNCILPKSKYANQNPNPNLGWDPLVSYGNEFLLKYNLTFKSGFGITFEAMRGVFGYRHQERYLKVKENNLFLFEYFVPIQYMYMGINLKASYRKEVTPILFIQPEVGIKSAFYKLYEMTSLVTDLNDEPISYLVANNLDCYRYFFPDLTAGINFLLHTKRNPRNNFILGVNLNIGFTPRYKGHYYITPPFQNSDADLTYRSTYIGINFGYEFLGLPKTFFRKKIREKQSYEAFDFKRRVHSIAIIYNNGLSFASKLKNATGLITPIFPGMYYNPEIVLKYSYSFRKGWGMAIEIPFGFFNRIFEVNLFGIVPHDTVWANGVVGAGEGTTFVFRTPYIGLSLKASYITSIHRNVFLQPEIGIRCTPFLHSASYWDFGDGVTASIKDMEMDGEEIVFMHYYPRVEQGSYWIPDLTVAINFMVHGKNPGHNFIFGINASFSFVGRMSWSYNTLASFTAYPSSGQFHWKMGFVGIHLGYQFMTGYKKG